MTAGISYVSDVFGKELDVFVISEKKTGRAKIICTPPGFEECLGLEELTVISRYLYTLPLNVVIRDKAPDDSSQSF